MRWLREKKCGRPRLYDVGLLRLLAIPWAGTFGPANMHDKRLDLPRRFANDVASVIDALGLHRYILVGHLMGGKVAQLLAARRPQGLAGLVLAGSSMPTPLRLSAQMQEMMRAAYRSINSGKAKCNREFGPGYKRLDLEQNVDYSQTLVVDDYLGIAGCSNLDLDGNVVKASDSASRVKARDDISAYDLAQPGVLLEFPWEF